MKDFDYFIMGDNVELFHVQGVARIILDVMNTEKPHLLRCSYRITKGQFELLKEDLKFQEAKK